MSDGKAKVSIWLELKNKLKNGLSTARDQIKEHVNQTKNKLKEVSGAHREMMESITESIPGASNMLGSLATLYTAIAAGIGVVIAGSIKLATHLFETSAAIKKHQQTIKATFGATGKEMNVLTARATASADIFERDFNEITGTANNFYQEFKDNGLTAAGSLSLLQKGLIATNNLMDMDNVREYSAHLKQAGFTASEAMGFIAAQTSKGVFSDKMVDSVKEFQLRITEMPKATQDALKGIGLNANKIARDINTGAKSTFQVMKEVSSAMKTANVVARQTAVADIFGGPGEDLGQRLLLTIGDINTNLDEQIAKMGTAAQMELRRLELAEQINMKQQEYAPIFNEINGKFQIMKLEGQKFFYDMVAKGIEWIKQYKDDFITIWDTIKPVVNMFFETWKVQWAVASAIFGSVVKLISWGIGTAKNSWELFTANIGHGMEMGKLYVKSFAEYTMGVFRNIGNAWEQLKSGNLSGSWDALTAGIKSPSADAMKTEMGTFAGKVKNIMERQSALDNKTATGIIQGYKDIFQGKGKKIEKLEGKPTETYGGRSLYSGGKFSGLDDGAGSKSKKGSGDGLSKVTGKADQVRNITFNMDAMMKMGDFITNNPEFAKMSPKDLEQWFSEMLKRAIANVENSYS